LKENSRGAADIELDEAVALVEEPYDAGRDGACYQILALRRR
jgi:hypothetical protein